MLNAKLQQSPEIYFLFKSLQYIYSKKSPIFDNRDVLHKFIMSLNISKITGARNIFYAEVI